MSTHLFIPADEMADRLAVLDRAEGTERRTLAWALKSSPGLVDSIRQQLVRIEKRRAYLLSLPNGLAAPALAVAA